MTSRQLPFTVDGSTQASNVIAVAKCNDAESGTFTRALDPLNCNAFPNFPAATHVAPETDPVFPFPDASATDDPDPSSNPYAATNPDGAGEAACAPTRRSEMTSAHRTSPGARRVRDEPRRGACRIPHDRDGLTGGTTD